MLPENLGSKRSFKVFGCTQGGGFVRVEETRRLRQDACDKATILETTDGSSSGGNEASFGWYLSSSVPEPILLKLNQEILKLKLNGDLDNIFEEVIGNAKLCGVAKLAISPLVLLIPLALVMGPPIILVVIVLLHKRIKIEKQ